MSTITRIFTFEKSSMLRTFIFNIIFNSFSNNLFREFFVFSEHSLITKFRSSGLIYLNWTHRSRVLQVYRNIVSFAIPDWEWEECSKAICIFFFFIDEVKSSKDSGTTRIPEVRDSNTLKHLGAPNHNPCRTTARLSVTGWEWYRP